MEGLLIRPLHPDGVGEARALILQGLEEHWGWLDPTLNPDLDQMERSYARETFLVAHVGDELVGTGALIREEEGVGRIVRMSVAKAWRRKGIASAILNALLAEARERGFRRVVLETTSTWEDAKGFYLAHGFLPVGELDGDTHFHLDLAQSLP